MSYFSGAALAQITLPDPYGSLSSTAMIPGQVETITLTDPIVGPAVVHATKIVPQAGLINSSLNSTASKYTLHDTAYATTLTPSATTGRPITLTLGTGSFAAGDVGKTITGNGGVAVVVTTTTANVTTDFTNTTAIASGSWTMESIVIDGAGIQISNNPAIGYGLTSSYDGASLYVNPYPITPRGLFFKPDGTSLYVLGNSNDRVWQYNLLTPWDLSTAAYASLFYDATSEESSPNGVSFRPGGSVMYILGWASNRVFQYNLSTAWDVSTASYGGAPSDSFDLSANTSDPQDIAFKPDGTKMYVIAVDLQKITQYTISAWNVNSAVYDTFYRVNAQESLPRGFRFNPAGTLVYVVGSGNDLVYRYTLGTAWDVSTMTYDGTTCNPGTESATAIGIEFDYDGTHMYVLGNANDTIYQYTTGSLVAPTSAYTSLITSGTGQIDTSLWTDINTMAANETLNAQTIHYAFSVDNQTTFQITKVTAGVRNIVRINGGTWQYNSNATYGAETWTAASTNDVYTALNQSAGVASNLMTGTQLAAAADADYFTLSTTFDMAAILYTTNADQIPSLQSIDVDYDVSSTNVGARLGTDYDTDQPDSTTVNFTALIANTYAVRIL